MPNFSAAVEEKPGCCLDFNHVEYMKDVSEKLIAARKRQGNIYKRMISTDKISTNYG